MLEKKEGKILKNNKQEYLENIRKELFLNLNKKTKNWKDLFDKIDNLNDLKEFYEKQKKTFWSKKISSTWSWYFYEFILAFLKFENKLDDRSKTIIFILIKNLKEINIKVANKIEKYINSDLKNEISKKITKNNNWELMFSNFDNIEEFLNYFDKARLSFSHRKKDNNTIEKYYIPFIKSFLSLKDTWLNSSYEEKVYKSIILLEANILDINPNYNTNSLLTWINYDKYVKLTISEKKSKKRWKDFFYSFSDISDIIDYYDKVKTTFWRKVKNKDIDFFKYFILSIKKYATKNDRIDTIIYTLSSYYKKLDLNYEDFFKRNNLELENLNKPISYKIDNYKEIFDKINNLDELLIFYKEQSKYFKKKVKQNNKEYFKLFIEKFKEYISEYNGDIDILTKLKNIEKHFKQLNNEFQLPEEIILWYTIKKKIQLRKTPIKKTSKVIKTKKTILKENSKIIKDNNNILKEEFNFEKEYKIMINNFQNKWKRNDWISWYNIWLTRFEKLQKNWYKFTKHNIAKIINLLKINDIYSLYTNGKIPDYDYIRNKIAEKMLEFNSIISIDEKYFDLFKKILKEYCKINDINISSLNNQLKYNENLLKYLKS